MRYAISKRDIAESVEVKDEDGVIKYLVKNNNKMPKGYHVSIYDDNDVEVLQVSKSVSSSKYMISDGDNPVAIVKSKMSVLRPIATIIRATGLYHIKGDFHNYHYYIIKDSETLARVSKGDVIVEGEYYLDIFNNEEHDFLVALVVILDGLTYAYNQSQQ